MKNTYLLIVILLFGAMMLYGIIERFCHIRRLRKISVRILVNGTRGKTTVTRLIASICREQGLLTYAKTTGSQAKIILPDGQETEYRKPNRPVNILEQIPFVKLAAKNKTEAIVVECMAVSVGNQRLMARHLIKPTIVVMTNAWVDHIDQIGTTEEETVDTLAQSIPKQAILVSDDKRFDEYTAHRTVPTSEPLPEKYLQQFSFTMFEANIRLALEAARLLGVDRELALEAMLKIAPDLGMDGPYIVNNTLFINAFAANDLQSAQKQIEKNLQSAGRAGESFITLYNHRQDREFRLPVFARLCNTFPGRCRGVYIIGDNKEKARRYFAEHTQAPAYVLSESAISWVKKNSKQEQTIVGLGNIKNEALELIAWLASSEKERTE
jgi:poly-gamma-glutamate synthase PgsB/CapB